MENTSIARVRYYSQQFLRSSDFSAEQAYHVAMRRRHNVGHHIWGVVHGLDLVLEEQQVFVQPGMAVDGYGRELILPERFRIPTESAFDAKNSDLLEVWLLYSLRGSNDAPAPRRRCDPEALAAFGRLQELPQIRLEPPDLSFPDPRRPGPVAQAGRVSAPQAHPSDDPADLWPVYLGRVQRDRSDPSQPVLSVDMARRPVVGVVADAVISPPRAPAADGEEPLPDAVVAVEPRAVSAEEIAALGGAHAGGITQRASRFSVALRRTDGGQDVLTEHLRIDGDGDVELRGRTRLLGDLSIESGAIAFGAAQNPNELPTHQSAPSPSGNGLGAWRIYRYRAVSSSGENDEQLDQLRIEMPGTPAAFHVGAWSPDDEAFRPFLTVSNGPPNGRVTVHGDLLVKGSVQKDLLASAARLTPQARDFLLSTFSSGVGGANLQLQRFYKSPSGEGLRLDTPEGRQAIVDQLSAMEPTVHDDFAAKLVEKESLRVALAKALFANAAALDSMIEKLLANQDAQNKIAEKLFGGASGPNQIGEFLLDNPGAIATALSAPLASDADAATNAIARALLDGKHGPEATGSRLAAMAEGTGAEKADFDTAAQLVVQSDTSRNRLVELIFGDSGGPASVAARLVASQAQRTAVLGVVLADRAGHVAELVLDHQGNPSGIQAVLAALDDNAKDRLTPFVEELSSNADRTEAFLEALLGEEDDTARERHVAQLFGHAEGPSAIGEHLASNQTTLTAVLDPVLAASATLGHVAGLVLLRRGSGNAFTGVQAVIEFLDTDAPANAEVRAKFVELADDTDLLKPSLIVQFEDDT